MTNILITGITGFIGSHLAQHLSDNKDNVIYGLHRSIKHESVFSALKLNEKENINLIYGDVNNFNTVNEAIVQYEIDNIYHLAAKVIVQDAAKFPVTTINTNMLGTLNILESIRLIKELRNKEIPTFVMSTDKTYGISNKLPYTEDLPLNGLDIYSASKACEDILARSYAYNYDLPIVVGRPANAYGLDFNWTRLIPSLAKSCLSFNETNKSLILNEGSYNYIREYNYVEDTVNALEFLLKNIDKTKGQAYNISSGYKYTTKEVVHVFLSLIDQYSKRIEFRKKDVIFKEIPEQYLNSSKIIKDTGWKPKYNLNKGLKETIEKYKEWFELSTHHADIELSTHHADIGLCNQKFC